MGILRVPSDSRAKLYFYVHIVEIHDAGSKQGNLEHFADRTTNRCTMAGEKRSA